MREMLSTPLGALAIAITLGCATKDATPAVVTAPLASISPSARAASVTSAPPADAPAPLSGDRSDLDSSIAIAIAILERKDYREFLEEFVAPEDRAHFDAEGGLDKILPEFAEDKAEELLEILKKTQGQSPRRENNRAIFERSRSKDVTWVLDHGRWYIKN